MGCKFASLHIPHNVCHVLNLSRFPGFDLTETLTQRTTLPPGTSSKAAIRLLQNHEFVLRLDPEYVSHIQKPTPPLVQPHIDAKYYTVTDHMTALPKGLYDSTVTFDAALTDTKNGTHWLIHGPLGYVQTTVWTIEGEEEELELVETAKIEAKLVLAGMIKKKILGNSPGIHRRFLEELAKGHANEREAVAAAAAA